MKDNYQQLEEKLGYTFTAQSLLIQALTHKSYAHENPSLHNERLEFLGDAVLQCSISQLLYHRYLDFEEGSLSKFRAVLVSEEGLAKIALEIGLGQYLKLGKGEEAQGGREKPSILSDALEAVIAACYIDSRDKVGMDAIYHLTETLFSPEIKNAETQFESVDYKTVLQEVVQKHKLGDIEYKLIEERGPDHQKEFHIQLQIGGQDCGRAWGTSKKRAEQQTALIGLEKVKRQL